MRTRTFDRPNVLTIAGSDSGGSAGVAIDLKTFATFGVHGLCAITATTAQNSRRVDSVNPVAARTVAAQLGAVYDDFRIAAVKIGMLANAAIASAVARELQQQRARNVVLDPVLVSTSGTPLLGKGALRPLRERLFPLVDVLTPNVPEAELLLGRRLRGQAGLEAAARDLLAFGPRAVLLKGGHLRGDRVVDVLVDARSVITFAHARLPFSVRGTGCALSSAIAAGLAWNATLANAVGQAEELLQSMMRSAYCPGRGTRRTLDFSAAAPALG